MVLRAQHRGIPFTASVTDNETIVFGLADRPGFESIEIVVEVEDNPYEMPIVSWFHCRERCHAEW